MTTEDSANDSDSQTSESLTEARIEAITTLYEIYRNYVIHEDLLIDRRTQRMLLIQGFSFAGLGAMLSKFGEALAVSKECPNAQSWVAEFWPQLSPTIVYSLFLILIACTGALTAFLARDGLDAANDAQQNLQKQWSEAVTLTEMKELHLPGIRGGGSEAIDEHGKLHLSHLAEYFIGVWIFFLILLTVYLVKHLFCI